MFLKKIEGPRIVKLPDGRLLSLSDLPPETTQRWVASRKEAVVLAVTHGLLGRDEAKKRYALSEEELTSWERALQGRGYDGLKVTHLQKH